MNLKKWIFYLSFFITATVILGFICGGLAQLLKLSPDSAVYENLVSAPLYGGFIATFLIAPDLYDKHAKK